MPAIQNKLAFEALRVEASGSLLGPLTYVNLGAPMAHPIRMFKLTSTSSTDVTVSYDGGTTDHEYLPAGSFILLDVTSDRAWDCEFALGAGVQVAIKGTAGTGNIYLSTYFAV